jgi:hypothetical protein
MKNEQKQFMKKKIARFALSAVLFALYGSALAQQPGKIPRIGYLNASSASSAASRVEAFRRGMSGGWLRRGEKHCR